MVKFQLFKSILVSRSLPPISAPVLFFLTSFVFFFFLFFFSFGWWFGHSWSDIIKLGLSAFFFGGVR